MQSLLELHFQDVPVELPSVFAGARRAKDVHMIGQEFVKDWMCQPKHSFLEQSKYTDVPAQNWRRKFEFQKSLFSFNT